MAAPTAAPQQPSTSGSFTNLNQYVKANRDQSQGLGSKLEGNVQKVAGAGLSELGAAGQEYKTGIEAATANPADAYSEAKIGEAVTAANAAPTSTLNETEKAAAQTQADSFAAGREKQAKLAAGSETPNLITQANYQSALGQLGTAKEKAGLTGTESGRKTLLQETYKRPDYSAGQQSLDQLLTQIAPENRQRLESLRQNLLGQYGLGSSETQAIQNAATQRAGAVANTNQAFQNMNNALYGKLGDEYTYGPIGADNLPTVLNKTTGVAVPRDASGNFSNEIFAPQAADATKRQTGAVTNIYGDIQAGAQTAQSALSADYNKKAADWATKLRAVYGDKPLGMEMSQVVNAIMGSTAPAATANAANPGSATMQNTMTEQQLGRLEALNRLAGRGTTTVGNTAFNRADVIDPTTGKLKDRFSTTAKEDRAAGKNILQGRSDIIGKDIQTKAATGLAQVQAQTSGQSNLVRLDDGTSQQPQRITQDAARWQKEYREANDLQIKAMKDINAYREAQGLSPVNIAGADIGKEFNRLINIYASGSRDAPGAPTSHYAEDIIRKGGTNLNVPATNLWTAAMLQARYNLQDKLLKEMNQNPGQFAQSPTDLFR